VSLIPLRIDQRQSRFPVATVCIVLADVLVFALTHNRVDFREIKLCWGFMPHYESLSTLFTHMFLHEGWEHLIGNLLFFILPAMKVEDVLGGVRFFLFYLSCGVAALAAHVAMAGTLPVPVIGASGAIAGVIGAFMLLYPNSRISFLVFPLPWIVRLRTWFFLGLWLLQEVLYGFFLHVNELDSPIAVWAHVGGFIFGAVSMWSFFGWDGGLVGECHLKGMQLLRHVQQMLLRPRLKRHWIGAFLLAFSVFYAGAVLSDGGFINKFRLNNEQEFVSAYVHAKATHQSVDSLMALALRNGTAQTELSDKLHRRFLSLMKTDFQSQVQYHEALMKKKAQPPGGAIGDKDRFFAEEFPHFPKKCQIGVEGVNALSVLYTPNLKYEIFCGTNASAKDVFLEYLKVLNQQGWMVENPLFDAQNDAGILESSDGEWDLSIIICHSKKPYCRTMVLWMLDKLQ